MTTATPARSRLARLPACGRAATRSRCSTSTASASGPRCRRRNARPTTATIRSSIRSWRTTPDVVGRAGLLVFVYPTWWSGLPAIMKGWLERVMVPGVGFRFNERTGKVEPGLGHVRRIVGISTYGSSRAYVRRRERQRPAHDHPGAADVVRIARPTDWLGLYGSTRRPPTSVTEFAARVERAMAESAMTSRAFVVFCHPPTTRSSARARSCARRARARGAEVRVERPVRRRIRSDVQPATEHPDHLRPRSRSVAHRLRRRSPVVRHARARVPDVVVGPAGDAQGMDRPRVGRRGGAGPCRPGATGSAPGSQHPATRRRHHARVAEVGQCDRRRGRQADPDPQPALDVSPARSDVLARDVRRRHLEPGAAGASSIGSSAG